MSILGPNDQLQILNEIEHFSRSKRRFNALMEGEPEVRERSTEFGTRAVVTSSIMIGLSLAGTIGNVLLTLSGSSVGAVILGLFTALFGLSFTISLYRVIPDVVWQRKLNDRKIGIAAIVLVILHGVFALALLGTGVLCLVSGFQSCAA